MRHSCETALRQCRPAALTPVVLSPGQGGTPEDAFAQGNRTSRKRQQKARKQAAGPTVVEHLLPVSVEGIEVSVSHILPPDVQVVAGQYPCPQLDL